MDEVILTTCPRDCYDACGVVVAKRDGQIRHVRGDPSHPVSRGRLCRKCATAYNGVLRDRDARLLAPLRRSGPKGQRAASSRWPGTRRWRRSRRGSAGCRARRSSTPTTPGRSRCSATPSRSASSTASARPRSTPTRSATRPGTSRSTTSTAARWTASTRAPRATPRASSSGGPTPRPRRPTSTTTGFPRRPAR